MGVRVILLAFMGFCPFIGPGKGTVRGIYGGLMEASGSARK